MERFKEKWSKRVSAARAVITASGRVLARVPDVFKRRRREDETALAWTTERLFCEGDEYFDALLGEIGEAQSAIAFETYIFCDDEIGARVVSALIAAAARGVEVRLLVDGVGSSPWIRSRGPDLARAGVQLRVYHPPPWTILPHGWPGFASLMRAFSFFRHLNRRNHRKMCLIDRRAAWVGSLNVDRRHLRSLAAEEAWRDVGARVEGAGLATLEKAFDRDWRHSWRLSDEFLRPTFILHSRRLRVPGGHLVRLNHGIRMRKRFNRDLLNRVASGQRRVWITSAYFIPNRSLLYSLTLASLTGADVRLMVPAKSDVLFMPWIGRAFYHRLARAGVRVFEYQPRMLHAKTVLVDGWLSVGSTNLNNRSLIHDLEVEVVLTHPESHKSYEEMFERDLADSREVDAQEWANRPIWERQLGRIGLLVKYFL
ncbi:MAG: cardiolipin synthase B [Planctomycetes bacterium]|nr:cardiolipin synthase B [Planctomycetota bacterium]